MRDLLKKLSGSGVDHPLTGIVVYTFFNFLRPAIGIILLPIYLAVFSPEEFGVYSIHLIIMAIVSVFVTLRLNSAMVTFYYDFNDDPEKLRAYMAGIFKVSLFIGLAVVGVFMVIGPFAFDLIFKSGDILFYDDGFIAISASMFAQVNAGYLTYLKNHKALKGFAVLTLINVLMTATLQYLFIVVLQWGVTGALLGLMIPQVLVFIVILVLEPQIVIRNIPWAWIRKSLSFGIPLIPYLLIHWFMTKGDRLFLERYLDLEVVGQYGLLVTLTGVIILFVEAIITGVRPFLFDAFKNTSKNQNEIGLLIKLIIIVPLFIIPFVVLVGNNLRFLTDNPTFLSVSPYFTLGCFIAYLMVYIKLFNQPLLYAKKSGAITGLSVVTIIVLIPAFILLIPSFRIWGVLCANMLALTITAVLFYFTAQRHKPLEYPLKQMIFWPVAVFTILFGLEYYTSFTGLSRMYFGIIQFVILAGLFIYPMYTTLKSYKALFMND